METLLSQEEPNLIICTHPFSSASVSRLKKLLNIPLTLCTVITDFHAHGAWVHSEVDAYLVANQHVHDQLIAMGVQKNRIVITGIPLRSNFWVKKNKQEIRKKLKLKENIPVVMIMGGGFGLGGIRQLAYSLLNWKEKIQVIICTGNNEKVRNAISRDNQFHHPHFHLLEFVEMIDEWMDASDLLITKPGGLTCFEALAKDLPLYIYQPIPGHEEKNCDFLVENNLAIRIDDSNSIDHLMEDLLLSEEISFSPDQIQISLQEIDPLASAEFIVNHLIHPKSLFVL
jgi:processive 1,2-diacylglycerol beta-glucosyltransferase